MARQRSSLFAWLLVANFLQNLLTSLQGPLYPPEAESKGMRPTTYGLVMSFFRVVLAASSLLLGINADKFNMLKLLVAGVMLDGMAAILFGALDFVEEYYFFTVGSFSLRGLEALGSIAIQFSIYTIIPFLEPDRVTMANGLAVSMDLLGLSVGPLLGTALADNFEFPAPFFIFGGIQTLVGVLIWYNTYPDFIKSPVANLPSEAVRLLRPYIKIVRQKPTVLIFVFACFVAGVGPDFLSAVLEPGIRHFNLSKLQVGLTFFYTAILQLVAPGWGALLDRCSCPDLFLGLSSLVMILALGMIGPLPGIEPNYNLTVAGLILFGLAQGACAVGSLASLRHTIKNSNLSINIIHVSFISTVLLCGTSVGEGTSAATAGILFENYGFAEASLFPMSIHLILIILLIIHMIHKAFRSKRPFLQETDPLLFFYKEGVDSSVP